MGVIIGVAVSVLVGAAVLLIGLGLEPRPVLHLWRGASDLQLTNGGIVGVAVLAAVATGLVATVLAGIGVACRRMAEMIISVSKLPQGAIEGVRAVLAIGLAAAALSGVFADTAVVRALLLIGLGFLAAIVCSRLFGLLARSERLTFLSRGGGLGGGSGGWEMSQPFALLLMLLLVLGAVVGLAQFERRAPPGSESKPEKTVPRTGGESAQPGALPPATSDISGVKHSKESAGGKEIAGGDASK